MQKKDRKKQRDFFKTVYALVETIPRGKVSSYGQIAGLISTPRAARVVGWALHLLDTEEIPWHRVINSRGEISTSCETHTRLTQKKLLEKEGVKVEDKNGVYVIDLEKYLWKP